MNNKVLLIIASLLILIGLTKPNLSVLVPSLNKPSVVNTIVLPEPTDSNIKAKCQDIIKALSVNNDRVVDGKSLSKLYYDLSILIGLDKDNEVIRNTEEIRQANKLAGLMLQLNLKDKYENLAETNHALIVEYIGDDNIPLTKELREKAVEGFKVLAWACNEGSK